MDQELLKAIVMGMVQGVTEFLPVSSTAHLILFPWIFGWGGEMAGPLAPTGRGVTTWRLQIRPNARSRFSASPARISGPNTVSVCRVQRSGK